MSEFQSKPNVSNLDKIIKSLCKGEKPDRLIEDFISSCDSLTQDEVSTVFYELEQNGYSYHDNPDVVNFYHDIIEDKISAGIIKQFKIGHPVASYLEENRLLRSLFNKIKKIDLQNNTNDFHEIFNKICKVELHYTRKENQLFPCLEKHGWDSPSKNMWAFHDEIRAIIKEVGIALKENDLHTVSEKLPYMIGEMSRLIGVEEERLFPNAMSLLEEDEWNEMLIGDEEIGWMLDKPPISDKRIKEEYVHPSKLKKPSNQSLDTDGKHHYDEGYMTPDQVNLLFRTMPFDITYVDENDQVVFYNRGEDRLFPRSKNVIGREVRYCHPPKSVDSVLRILEEFRNGTKDVADFRIFVKGRFIWIRYFAVRDNDGTYRGVMEMSQDITDIKDFEGEKRLLDWN